MTACVPTVAIWYQREQSVSHFQGIAFICFYQTGVSLKDCCLEFPFVLPNSEFLAGLSSHKVLKNNESQMNKFLLPKAEINNRHFKSLGGKSGEQGLWGNYGLWKITTYTEETTKLHPRSRWDRYSEKT